MPPEITVSLVPDGRRLRPRDDQSVTIETRRRVGQAEEDSRQEEIQIKESRITDRKVQSGGDFLFIVRGQEFSQDTCR